LSPTQLLVTLTCRPSRTLVWTTAHLPVAPQELTTPKTQNALSQIPFLFSRRTGGPLSAIPRRFSAPPLKRDRYLILSRSSYISPGNYILFTAITPLCTDNGGVVGSGGGGCAIISKFRTFFVRNFDERNDVQELQVGPGDKWFADSPNWLNWRPYGARWAKRSDHHNAQLSRAHLNANPTE
jgi:hypothetical protein